MLEQIDKIEFSVRKSIDRIQISLRLIHRPKIIERLILYLNQPGKKVYTDEANILEFKCSLDKEYRILVVDWHNSPYFFALMLLDPNEKVQQIIIDEILVNTKRSLSQVEFATDLYPKNNSKLDDLQNIISTGLTLKYNRGCGFRRYKEDHDEEIMDDSTYTIYIGSYGFVRKHTNYDTGKKRSVAKGLTIYQKPEKSNIKEYLRVELRLNRGYIQRKFKKYSLFREIIKPEYTSLQDFIQYRFFSLKKFEGVEIFRKKRKFLLKKTQKEHLKNYLLHSSDIRRHLIESDIRKYDEVVSCYSNTVAIPVLIDRLKKRFPGLKDRISSFFPIDKEKQKILQDIENGFVRVSYFNPESE